MWIRLDISKHREIFREEILVSDYNFGLSFVAYKGEMQGIKDNHGTTNFTGTIESYFVQFPGEKEHKCVINYEEVSSY